MSLVLFREQKCLNQFIIIFLNCISLSWAEERGNFSVVEKSFSTAKYENCGDVVCSEKQFCNRHLSCQCRKEFINYDGHCTYCAGEQEFCSTTELCCQMLYCINNTCRKPAGEIEFITLTKISLGITVTIVLTVALIFFLKTLLNFNCGTYRECQRDDDIPVVNSISMNVRQLMNQRPFSYDVRNDMPPSYEECMLSSKSNVLELPPPYVISANIPPAISVKPQDYNGFISTVHKVQIMPLNIKDLEISN